MGLFGGSKSSSSSTQNIRTEDNKVTGADSSRINALSDLSNNTISIESVDPFIVQEAFKSNENVYAGAIGLLQEGFQSVIDTTDSFNQRVAVQSEADKLLLQSVVENEQEGIDTRTVQVFGLMIVGGLGLAFALKGR